MQKKEVSPRAKKMLKAYRDEMARRRKIRDLEDDPHYQALKKTHDKFKKRH